MGMSDEMMRKIDKRSKEEKKEMVGRIMTEKTPNIGQDDRKHKNAIMAKIWDVVRKLAGQRGPK